MKDEAEIVGGHLNTFEEVQSVLSGQVCHTFKIPHTLFRISPPEISVESFVARSCVDTVLLVGSVQIKHPSRRKYPPCPSH